MKLTQLINMRPGVWLVMLLTGMSVFAQESPLMLYGRIKEATFKNDLLNAWIFTIDGEGNRKDSLRVGSISQYVVTDMHGTLDRSEFSLPVSRADSTYVFEVGCDGYTPQTVVCKVENVGAREKSRTIPDIFLSRAPHKLGEVEVTATKVKFYHRGDTLVYNADAFQLAEGSMLDALIAQLPGVVLKDNGQITVNGEFVESLLLNGKQFFDGNNNIMLQNIGAYTVKNVEVYRGHTQIEKFHEDLAAPKHLTMDVKLKKEYSIGTIANAQAGYGTEDRYLARLFAAWFTSTTEVALLANFNNLNDNREPGRDGAWSPDRMPTGTRRYQLAGVNYRYQPVGGDTRFANGNLTYTGNRLVSRTSTDRTNFFASGDTYDYSYGSSRYKDFRVNTRHQLGKRFGKVNVSATVGSGYSKTDNASSSLSSSFDEEQTEISMNILENIYDAEHTDRLTSLINRSKIRNEGTTKAGNVSGSTLMSYRIPSSPDRLMLSLSASYSTQNTESWRDFDVRYRGNTPADVRRNYTDGSPDNNLNLGAGLTYSWSKGNLNGSFNYDFSHGRRERDTYLYALEQLGEDMGVYGTLPAGYQSTLDAPNSYASTLDENRHTLKAKFFYSSFMSNGSSLQITFNPSVSLLHSHLDYVSDGVNYPIRRTTGVYTLGETDGMIRYQWGGGKSKMASQILTLKFGFDTKTPDLFQMVDVVNTADPLNIALGNTGLKNAYTYNLGLFYRIAPRMYFSNTLTADWSSTYNALVRGYYYDRSTGVRYNKTYNVDGTNSIRVEDIVNYQFGSRRQFTLAATTSVGNVHSVDMTGTDGNEPRPSIVNTLSYGENLRLAWTLGKQTLALKGAISNRHTSSPRADFRNINAYHYNYGLTGTFSLPARFGISTDFTLYSRHGYGMAGLDTNDAVWNVRLTYKTRGGRWIFMADGFDLLHQLSNVNYAVNATGRTVTYTNTLPRYFMFSVQYRINIKPKK